jgi:hypothetical protein
MTKLGTTILATASLLTAGTAGTVLAGEVEFDFPSASFSTPTNVDNDYWPLSALGSAVYEAESDEGCEVNQLLISGATRGGFGSPYDGLEAIVVVDREWLDPDCGGSYVLVESTEDWFAQDDDDNVWYLGEDTTSWDEDANCLSSHGSWEAGSDGAEAGVVMPGRPRVGNWYQQEFFEDEAEDRAKILRLNARVSIEFGDYANCLKTKEYTPLEPGSVEHKYYCRMSEGGFGLMLIEELKGKTLRVEYIGAGLPAGTFPLTFPTLEGCTE